MSQDQKNVIAFDVNAVPARQTRYTLANPSETAEGGRVGVGKDQKGNSYLVHEIGRATEAVALHAVATAIAGGSIPVAAVVAAFGQTGNLSALGTACLEAGFKPPTPPVAPKK